jgi:hypothetical protein
VDVDAATGSEDTAFAVTRCRSRGGPRGGWAVADCTGRRGAAGSTVDATREESPLKHLHGPPPTWAMPHQREGALRETRRATAEEHLPPADPEHAGEEARHDRWGAASRRRWPRWPVRTRPTTANGEEARCRWFGRRWAPPLVAATAGEAQEGQAHRAWAVVGEEQPLLPVGKEVL